MTPEEMSHVKKAIRALSVCSCCGTPRDRNGRYCKACHRAYMRKWRADRKPMERAITAAVRELRAHG